MGWGYGGEVGYMDEVAYWNGWLVWMYIRLVIWTRGGGYDIFEMEVYVQMRG